MARKEIAIEFGTTNTTIFLAGQGVVLSEPSVVALTKSDKTTKTTVKAVGRDAVRLDLKTIDNTAIVYPIIDGIVVDEDACALMLRGFLDKLVPSNAVLLPKYKALLCVPLGLTTKERYQFENVCIKSGIDDITIVESAIATAVGMDVSFDSPLGTMIVNMGGGKTEIAVIGDSAIVEGVNLSIGGNAFDKAIATYMLEKYSIVISTAQACKIKVDIGCVYTNDNSETVVTGYHMLTRESLRVAIRAIDVAQCLKPLVDSIISNIDIVIKKCSPALSEHIYTKGLYICGGLAQIEGLDKLISTALNVKVWQVENPAFVSIIGAGKLLTNREALHEIIGR